MENRLAELTFKDYASLQDRHEIINATIEEFVTGLPHDVPMAFQGEVRKAIDECFAADDMQEVISRVEGYKGDANAGDWAEKTLKALSGRSPTSLKVSLKQMQLGGNWSIADAFDREYNIASVFMKKHDFVEGVTAKLIQKPPATPNWQPATLDDVSWDEVDTYFANPRDQERLQLLNTGLGTSYMKYPHGWIGLPNEGEVEDYVREHSDKSKAQVVNHFMQLKNGKIGVREKVQEMLKRKTSEKGGTLSWEEPQISRESRGSQDPVRTH